MTTKSTNKKIAIITGASSGLGKEFALQIDRNYFLDEIWLIARRADPMKEIAENFQKSKGVIIPLDLTSKGDLSAFEKRLNDEKPSISFLVNNAGYGKLGPFAELGAQEQMKMIDLNVNALTFLTKISIPFMKKGASIIQVASSIAFCPAPFFAVYAASKSYVLSLSEALNYELREQGIHVLAVCPGPVATEFFNVAQKNEFMKDKVGEAEPFNSFLMANAREVVEKALYDASKNRRVSIFGFPIQVFAKLTNFIPKSIAIKAMARRKPAPRLPQP